MRSTFLFLVFVLVVLKATAQFPNKIIIDLKPTWLVHGGPEFEPFQNQTTSSIYFWLPASQYKGTVLSIAGRHSLSIFVDSKLIWSGQQPVIFSVDSLAKLYSARLFISIYSPAGFKNVSTKIVTQIPIDDTPQNALRGGNFFLDFAIIASLMLLVSFTMFVRTNPMLTQDYFDFRKLLSTQDRTESGFGLRIASSVNILYYFFGSCFLALILLSVFHFMKNTTYLSAMFQMQTTPQGFGQWAILSLAIFGFLIFKLLWITVFATLFDFKDTVRFQFFNFIRLIFISVAALMIIGLGSLLFNVRSELFFYYQIYLLAALFVIGTSVVYLKLMTRLPYHFFHLFSYLCASEIIPLILLMKVILY